MDHGSPRGGSSCLNVCCRSRDGAGGAEPAEKRGDDVRKPVADQLAVGIMSRRRQPVAAHGGDKRLDGAKHGDGECPLDQAQEAGEGIQEMHPVLKPPGQLKMRGEWGNPVIGHAIDHGGEMVFNGVKMQGGVERRKDHPNQAGNRENDECRRDVLEEKGPDKERDEREGPQDQIGAVACLPVCENSGEFAHNGIGGRGDDSEETPQLKNHHRDRDPHGESGDDREGNEVDQLSQFQKAEEQEDQARESGGDHQSGGAEFLDDRNQDDDEGGGRPRDLIFRPSENPRHKAAYNRRVESRLRRHAGGDRERHRERQRDRAHNDPGDGVTEKAVGRESIAEGASPSRAKIGKQGQIHAVDRG